MAKALLSIGIMVIFFIVVFGLGTYFLVTSFTIIKRNRHLIKTQEKELRNSNKKIEEKKAKLEELSKKIRRAGRKLGRVAQVKELKESLREEHKINNELQMEVKRLKHNLKLQNKEHASKKTEPPKQKADEHETSKMKQKYPNLPKNQLERIEIERSVARSLIRNNGGSFHISQLLRKMEKLYPKHINPNARIMLLNEIKNWIERDPLCRAVRTSDRIQHYTFI